MELELQGWKVKLALVAMAAVVVVLPFARATMVNKDRAEDWHRRAVVAEEAVGGLRAVIVERSRALNRRTVQANRLATAVQSNGTALRRSKVSVGALSRRQRDLEREVARLAAAGKTLRSRVTTLERIGATLSACAKAAGSTSKASRAVATAAARSQVDSCKRAGARFDAYLEQGP